MTKSSLYDMVSMIIPRFIILIFAVYSISFCLFRHWNGHCLRLLIFLIFCILVLTPIFLYFIMESDVGLLEDVFPLPNRLSLFLVPLLEVALFFVMRCRQQEIYKHVLGTIIICVCLILKNKNSSHSRCGIL